MELIMANLRPLVHVALYEGPNQLHRRGQRFDRSDALVGGSMGLTVTMIHRGTLVNPSLDWWTVGGKNAALGHRIIRWAPQKIVQALLTITSNSYT